MISLQVVRDVCRDKSVVLVGNGIETSTRFKASLIDSYDIVVRFNEGYTRAELIRHMGVRTDLWVNNMVKAHLSDPWEFHQEIYDQFILAPRYILRLREESLPPSLESITYRWKPAILDRFKQRHGSWPCAGCKAVYFFASLVRVHRSIDLVGFDYFRYPNPIFNSRIPTGIRDGGKIDPRNDEKLIKKILCLC